MAWQNFRVRKSAVSEHAPATLATFATLPHSGTETVATVASVAAPHAETALPTVASVATVAGVQAKTENVEGVPPGEVAMLFERIVAFLMKDGRGRSEAEIDALSVLRSRLANDARLMPFTKFSTVCAMCGADEGNGVSLLPILSSRKGTHIWLHMGDCHQQHRDQHAARVEACIAAAGIAGPKREWAA
jgi:hypothetical protein